MKERKIGEGRIEEKRKGGERIKERGTGREKGRGHRASRRR